MSKPKKPTAKKIERLDYYECQDYLQEKHPDMDFDEFWGFLVDYCDISNGCEFWMPEAREAKEDWQKPILEAFQNEFGEGPYHVSW